MDLRQVLVTIQDARSIGYCRRGSYAFSQRHGITWSRFLNEGIPATELAAIDDEMVKAVIEQAIKRTRAEASDGQV